MRSLTRYLLDILLHYRLSKQPLLGYLLAALCAYLVLDSTEQLLLEDG